MDSKAAEKQREAEKDVEKSRTLSGKRRNWTRLCRG